MGKAALRPVPMDVAGELAGCAVFGWDFFTCAPDPQVLGETGEILGRAPSGELRLRFTPEQASRMAERADGGPA